MHTETNTDVRKGDLVIALSAEELAERLGVSLRHIRQMDSTQLLPKPIRLGRSVRWSVDEISAWMKAGAPDRRRWEQLRARRTGRGC